MVLVSQTTCHTKVSVAQLNPDIIYVYVYLSTFILMMLLLMYTKICFSLLSFWYIAPVYRMTDFKSTYWHIFFPYHLWWLLSWMWYLYCLYCVICQKLRNIVNVQSLKQSQLHYDDVIMGAIASLITSLTIVYSTLYSYADQIKHQSSPSLAIVWGIHRGPVNSPHKWPATRKMFPFDDVMMV